MVSSGLISKTFSKDELFNIRVAFTHKISTFAQFILLRNQPLSFLIYTMKTENLIMNRTIILFFFIALIFSCTNEIDPGLTPEFSDFSYSECGGFKSRFINPTEEEIEKLVIRAKPDGYYQFDHTNVSFNCCLPKGISASLSLSNDTLYLNEKETVPGSCKCLCNYDIISEIKNLEKGNYVLCLLKDSIVRGTISLFFNAKMYEEIVISDLIE
jgi:hypothetical protein